ncbi:MAG: ERF family protein [Nitrososphaera sp.]|nr:ERF family protein [Nitrososphaera sp.]
MTKQTTELAESKETALVEPTALPAEMQALIKAAIEKESPLEVLRELRAMRKEIIDEWAEREFNKAMNAVRSECPIVPKSQQGDKGKWKFAPIQDLLTYRKDDKSQTIEQILVKNGFSWTWEHNLKEGVMTVTCIVRHVSGYKDTKDASFPVVQEGSMNKSQAGGSAMSYGERYSFKGAFGIVTGGTDDDGDAAGKETKLDADKSLALESQIADYVTDFQRDPDKASQITKGWMQGVAQAFGVKSGKLSDLPTDKFEDAKALIKSKIDEHRKGRSGT